jgi:hypothetical protein
VHSAAMVANCQTAMNAALSAVMRAPNTNQAAASVAFSVYSALHVTRDQLSLHFRASAYGALRTSLPTD